MALQRMDHVGVVVDDLAAAIAFFAEVGFEVHGEVSVDGPAVDRINGLDGVQADVAMLQTPDGNGRLELSRYRSPPHDGEPEQAPANTPGIRHIACAVDDLDAVLAGLRNHGAELVGEVEAYGGSYRLCYVRGPAGMIVELAEKIG
jgi:catechol 2,3-dioxygenase-like lactoylglutathione lyase family enzyme